VTATHDLDHLLDYLVFADGLQRLATADALEEVGRTAEAAIVRDLLSPLTIHDGEAGRFVTR
jgi:hypothetical protein